MVQIQDAFYCPCDGFSMGSPAAAGGEASDLVRSCIGGSQGKPKVVQALGAPALATAP